jgi:hypothetical protein
MYVLQAVKPPIPSLLLISTRRLLMRSDKNTSRSINMLMHTQRLILSCSL